MRNVRTELCGSWTRARHMPCVRVCVCVGNDITKSEEEFWIRRVRVCDTRQKFDSDLAECDECRRFRHMVNTLRKQFSSSTNSSYDNSFEDETDLISFLANLCIRFLCQWVHSLYNVQDGADWWRTAKSNRLHWQRTHSNMCHLQLFCQMTGRQSQFAFIFASVIIYD